MNDDGLRSYRGDDAGQRYDIETGQLLDENLDPVGELATEERPDRRGRRDRR
ncbi:MULTISPECIES: hypothetical protein [Actinomycetes]|uniref:Uncharacterized protein n=1 Tax=Amycolatopsis deserti TaxID=185696 RepID=A0ABQ3JNF6_9PSEU|nr:MULTISPECIES: hypothetical protein [Actinomycetes]GHF30889.1 hypothetical protein GCM10017786_76000 [Amycolatopsis deserti]